MAMNRMLACLFLPLLSILCVCVFAGVTVCGTPKFNKTKSERQIDTVTKTVGVCVCVCLFVKEAHQ